MAKLSEAFKEKWETSDIMADLYLLCLKKMERAEKMNKNNFEARYGKDGKILLAEIRREITKFHENER